MSVHRPKRRRSCDHLLVNRLVEWVIRRSPFLVQTPWVRNIGNCAEEMYYGLLRARREGKRVVFLRPVELVWRLRFGIGNPELFNLESPFCVRRRMWHKLLECGLTAAYGPLRAAYLLWRRLRASAPRILPHYKPSEPNVWYTLPSIGRASLWKPIGVDSFSWEVAHRFDWRRQIGEYLPVGLRVARLEEGKRLRQLLGIPGHQWFACLHVREGGFRRDEKESASRNSSISNYLGAIQLVVDSGGWVVRLGDISMTRVSPMAHVVDYAHSPLKCPWMDLYLISQCRFFIGTNSGLLDAANLFQRPLILTNLSEWTLAFPLRQGDLAILKHVYSRSRGRFLSLRELLEEPFECQSFDNPGSDYLMVENTADEIRDVVEEFLHRATADRLSPLQTLFNQKRSAQLHRWLDGEEATNSRLRDVVERYRIASRADSACGAIGQKYLEKNWEVDSLNQAWIPGNEAATGKARPT